MVKNEPRKLYRSSKDRMISGVCGGTAEYFNIDPTIIRILWVLTFFAGGLGLMLYIAATIIVPVAEGEERVKTSAKSDTKAIWGTILIVFGLLLFIGPCGIFLIPFSFGIGWGIFGPILLIAAGLVLIFALSSKNRSQEETTSGKKLFRQTEGRMFLGVAGGTGEHFSIDPAIARLLWAAFIIISGGLGLIVYFIMYFIMPENHHERSHSQTSATKDENDRSRADSNSNFKEEKNAERS